jgi:hypothetical protein
VNMKMSAICGNSVVQETVMESGTFLFANIISVYCDVASRDAM